MGFDQHGSTHALRAPVFSPILSRLTPILICLTATGAYSQQGSPQCVQPTCVSRADDRAGEPIPGTLRYAILHAPRGAAIQFDPKLNGQTIKLDAVARSPIRITQDVVLQGPG